MHVKLIGNLLVLCLRQNDFPRPFRRKTCHTSNKIHVPGDCQFFFYGKRTCCFNKKSEYHSSFSVFAFGFFVVAISHAQNIELDRFHGNSKEAIQRAPFNLGAVAIIFILFALFCFDPSIFFPLMQVMR